MNFALRRAAALALVLAAAAPFTLASPALAQDARVLTAESNPELQKRADALFRGVKDNGGAVSYGALEAGAGPEGLVIKQIEIVSADKKKVTIEEIEIKSYDWANPREPRHGDLAMKKLVVAADQLDADARANFAELGLSTLTVSGELAFQFDDKSKIFDVSKLNVDVAEMGEFRLRLKLSGISASDLKTAMPTEKPGKPAPGKPNSQEAQAMMGLLSRLNIEAAAIAFKDKSLVERMVRADAKKKNMTEAAAREKMLEQLAAERGKAEDDVTKEFLDAASTFLRKPGEIELALAPPAPANLMAAFMMVMGNRTTFKQMMGLTLSVK